MGCSNAAIHLIALVAGLSAGQASAAQPASPDLRGIYIYTNDVSRVSAATATALKSSFTLPGVDGVALVIGWDALEPAILLYANGFGPTSTSVVSGSLLQSGTLSPQPSITIGGAPAQVQFAGLVAPGEFQFNVVLPSSLSDGDQPITATYNGAATQNGTLVTIQH